MSYYIIYIHIYTHIHVCCCYAFTSCLIAVHGLTILFVEPALEVCGAAWYGSALAAVAAPVRGNPCDSHGRVHASLSSLRRRVRPEAEIEENNHKASFKIINIYIYIYTHIHT